MNISDGFVPIGKTEFEKKHDANAEALEKAIDEVVAKQLDLGIDVVNDGELPRENYFLHFVRKIKGIDADNLVAKTVRNGKLYQAKLKKYDPIPIRGRQIPPTTYHIGRIPPKKSYGYAPYVLN